MRNDDETRDEDGDHSITGIKADPPPPLARERGNPGASLESKRSRWHTKAGLST